jgi:homoserine kinase
MAATAEAPCTVGNFGPGFDVFSLALARRGDVVTLAPAQRDVVRVTGAGAERVPAEWRRNAACAVVDALRAATGIRAPLEVRIDKGMPPGSGLGSSASSGAAALRAFLHLHDLTLSPQDALRAAGAGEAVATGGAHYDDVAAALYGGLVIVGGEGLDAVVRLRPPPLHLVVARPEVDLPTREMRQLIPGTLPRADVVHNLSNVARVVHACHAQDATMLCRALDDLISVKHRAPKVPGFREAREAAMKAGALGFLLSGSGPTVIAAMPATDDPGPVEAALVDGYRALGIPADVFVTTALPEVNDDALPLHPMLA